MPLLEPSVSGVQLGDRGLHVFDVEPHLSCDSPLLIEAVQLEQFVPRRSRAQICSADV